MSGLVTRLSIGIGKWEKLKNVPDLSDGLYDRLKISCERILVDLLMDKEREKSFFFPFPKFSHTCWHPELIRPLHLVVLFCIQKGPWSFGRIKRSYSCAHYTKMWKSVHAWRCKTELPFWTSGGRKSKSGLANPEFNTVLCQIEFGFGLYLPEKLIWVVGFGLYLRNC